MTTVSVFVHKYATVRVPWAEDTACFIREITADTFHDVPKHTSLSVTAYSAFRDTFMFRTPITVWDSAVLFLGQIVTFFLQLPQIHFKQYA
jgi:hypothetical protein